VTDTTLHALGFSSLDQEVEDVQLPVDGALPDWLTGMLIRTGPARFEIGAQSYTHWFDGLAMLHAFAFAGGEVRYSNRFLHSRSWQEAHRSGRIARGEFMTDPCRTLFGRARAIFAPRLTDNASVNVAMLGNDLVAMTETTMPIRFDPFTLEAGRHRPLSEAVRGQITTAHPHVDGERSYSYVIDVGLRCAYRLFVEDRGRQRVLASLPVDEPSYMHSFGMSERYLVLTEFPLRVSPYRLAFSGKPFITNYRWQPERGTRLTVVDKETGGVVARAAAPACFSFHHVNAFEADGAVHVDLLAYPDAGVIDRLRLEPLRAGAPPGPLPRLLRFRVPLDGFDEHAIEPTALCEVSFELPSIDASRRGGRSYSRVWGVGLFDRASFIDSVVKIELTDGESRVRRWHEPGCYPGEPVYVPRPGGEAEDDGVLLSVVLDSAARSSFLLVLDADSLAERARATAPHHIPFGFHGRHFPRLTRPAHDETTGEP
jgi:carotenoid cleavage dioxygenase-like enzyme